MNTHPQAPRALRVLSLIPPMTQLNTPYPSTAYLTGFLRGQGVDAVQDDLALKLVLALFTPEGLLQVRERALGLAVEARSACVNFFLDHFARYHHTIAPTVAFLQGRERAQHVVAVHRKVVMACAWHIQPIELAQGLLQLVLLPRPFQRFPFLSRMRYFRQRSCVGTRHRTGTRC